MEQGSVNNENLSRRKRTGLYQSRIYLKLTRILKRKNTYTYISSFHIKVYVFVNIVRNVSTRDTV